MRVARRQLRVAPATYDAILGYLRDVVPPSALVPLHRSLRNALQHGRHDAGNQRRGHALPHDGRVGGRTRALNVMFEADGGRRFLTRNAIDIVSTGG
jgi:membrane protein